MAYFNRENNYGGDLESISDAYFKNKIEDMQKEISERTRIISDQKMIIQHLKDDIEELKSLKNK